MYFRYENSAWEYISDGKKFEQVASNPTDRIWGVMNDWAVGYQIAEYDQNLGKWKKDATQPELASWNNYDLNIALGNILFVDSNGRPAFTTNEGNLWYK